MTKRLLMVTLLVAVAGLPVRAIAQSLPFHIPPLYEGEMVDGIRTFHLNMVVSTTEFIAGKPTPTFGYNGSFLGPTLYMRKGENVLLNVTNLLGESTSTHWHGFHVPAKMDGGPHQIILDGETWPATFTVLNRASTYWYHPHQHAHHGVRDPTGTSGQVFRGLAGMIIVLDEESGGLHLPSKYGIDDIPLIIQDRTFDPNGAFVEFPFKRPRLNPLPSDPPEGFEFPARKGDQFLINGVITPTLQTHAQWIRLRVLNASNARTYNLGFSDNRTFYQIGSDGGLLENPVPLTRLLVTVAERMDIVVDFSRDEGMTLTLKAFNSEHGADLLPDNLADVFDRTDFELCTLSIGERLPDAMTQLPEVLTEIERIPLAEGINVNSPRPFVLSHQPILSTPGMPFIWDFSMTINGKSMDMSRIDEVIQLGQTEVWEIYNDTGQVHPFHIHGDSFQVIARTALDANGVTVNLPLPANELGWKDTVQVAPFNTVQIIKRFEDFADANSPYMYHCHILDHEDAGMMGQFVVVDGNSLVQETQSPSHPLP